MAPQRDFPQSVINDAWLRQAGLCAACGKPLDPDNKTLDHLWNVHHRKAVMFEGGNSLGNCVLLCVESPNCHLNVGHEGDFQVNPVLHDEDLPYLYAGNS